MEDKDKLRGALYKKALGFDTEEVVEEYQDEGAALKLIKRKVTKKNVPPDITAIKLLLDGEKGVAEMTDGELEAEKLRLLKLLSDLEKGEVNEKKKEKRGKV